MRDLYYRLPVELRQAILVRRRLRIWRRAGIVFIHIPKAAGTSINLALYGRFMGHVRASEIDRWASAEVAALPSFAVTRNPWDRLVSAYRFARRGAGVGGASPAQVWRPQQYRGPEFESFATFVTDWLANRDIRRLDYAFQPQSLFVCDEKRTVLVDHIGRLEDLRPTYDFIQQHVGAVPRIDQTNRSGDAVDYRRFYTSQLVDAVGRIYAEDVGKFGYSFGD